MRSLIRRGLVTLLSLCKTVMMMHLWYQILNLCFIYRALFSTLWSSKVLSIKQHTHTQASLSTLHLLSYSPQAGLVTQDFLHNYNMKNVVNNIKSHITRS